MRSSKKAVVPAGGPIRTRRILSFPNSMVFPHKLRDAIPGPEFPGCGVEETGKLSGTFNVCADLNVEAAKALSATLQELVERLEHTPDGPPPLPFV